MKQTCHTVESTSNETGSVSDAVSMAANKRCGLITAHGSGLTVTPVPGAPDKYGHMVRLQMRKLIVRDTFRRSAANAVLYRSRQDWLIGSELTDRLSWMEFLNVLGFAADGCCATADPETASSPNNASTHYSKLHPTLAWTHNYRVDQ